MTIENQIAELLAQAEPLRALDDDDEAKEPLRLIVDRINALRAEQELASMDERFLPDELRKEVSRAAEEFYGTKPPEAWVDMVAPTTIPARRKPGPKPKVAE
jgi:hypothetical protein